MHTRQYTYTHVLLYMYPPHVVYVRFFVNGILLKCIATGESNDEEIWEDGDGVLDPNEPEFDFDPAASNLPSLPNDSDSVISQSQKAPILDN